MPEAASPSPVNESRRTPSGGRFRWAKHPAYHAAGRVSASNAYLVGARGRGAPEFTCTIIGNPAAPSVGQAAYRHLLQGISQGCVYGLIALGFVLIYKATEMVNFAQGDMMMLGAFIAVSLIEAFDWLFAFVPVLGALPGASFAFAFLGTLLVMAGFGVVLERAVLRPMIGEPPFAVLMLTIGLGFVLRAVAGAIWGNQPRALDSPFAGGTFEFGA